MVHLLSNAAADRHFLSLLMSVGDGMIVGTIQYNEPYEFYSTQTPRNAMESLDTGGNPGQQVRRHLKKNLEMAP